MNIDTEAKANLSEAEHWQAVLNRDPAYDGAFVYAVKSTGIYCRPSCPSRKPKPESVVFFNLPDIAEQAGYQACKRCNPRQVTPLDPQVIWVHEVCEFIEEHLGEPLTLKLLGERFSFSPSHLQRRFKQVAGISPLQYLHACRLNRFKSELKQGKAISTALYGAGFSSPSRLYSRSAAELGMTPRSYQNGGSDIQIRYTVLDSPLGKLLLAGTSQGVCAVMFGDMEREMEEDLISEFENAIIQRNDVGMREWSQAILRHLEGSLPHLELPMDVQATAFQRQVWDAIRAIPYGETRTYRQIAEVIDRPRAVRAVARACATNPVAIAVPCHRVLRSDGSLAGYRWGLERKAALLEKERENKDITTTDY